MSNQTVFSYQRTGKEILRKEVSPQAFGSDTSLPASITRAASKQTYYTIRLLADRDRVLDAYRAYAYFRWVDDWLDEKLSEQAERIVFAERQQALIDCCYRGGRHCHLRAEEHMLVALIDSDREQDSGLRAYIENMMAVMTFDAKRRGWLISQQELTRYSSHLAIAVTEALHYFIGHGQFAPQGQERYYAVTAAHITHMLRDTCDDLTAGYYNIPYEYLRLHRIEPCDLESDPYREWVKSRVQLARSYFKLGRDYLAQIENARCRLAGYTYIARFQDVLDTIERDDYRLRPAYQECSRLKVGWTALSLSLHDMVSPKYGIDERSDNRHSRVHDGE